MAILSPAAGALVEVILAWRFGASQTVDAFRIATLLLVFGTQLSFQQVLPHVIVPLFLQYRAREREREGWRLAFSIASILGLVSLLFVFWVWFNPETLVSLLAPGLAGSGKADALLLVRYFSLAVVLMVWSGVMGGILYAHRIFWAPLAGQLLTNSLVILAIFSVGREMGSGSLAIGVLLGSFASFVLHLYLLSQVAKSSNVNLIECLKWGPRDGVTKALGLSVPLITQILLSNWSFAVINRVLSEMEAGTVAEVGYAFKLQILVTLMSTSLATVLFPEFSDNYVRDDHSVLARLVMKGIRITLLLTVPLASLLFVMSDSVVFLVLQWGAMDSSAANDISALFGILLISAPAYALAILLGKVAYSMGDTKSPATVILISALLITLLASHAASVAGATGVMWAFSAIAWVEPLGLLIFQAWRHNIVKLSAILRYACLVGIMALSVIVVSSATREVLSTFLTTSKPAAVGGLIVVGSVSALFCYFVAKAIGVYEASELVVYVRWQGSRILRFLSFEKG